MITRIRIALTSSVATIGAMQAIEHASVPSDDSYAALVWAGVAFMSLAQLIPLVARGGDS